MDATVIKQLKHKAIDEYNILFNKLQKGYKLKYDKILDIICFIEIYSNLKNYNNYIAHNLLR